MNQYSGMEKPSNGVCIEKPGNGEARMEKPGKGVCKSVFGDGEFKPGSGANFSASGDENQHGIRV